MNSSKKSNILRFEEFKSELQRLSGKALLVLEGDLSNQIEKILLQEPHQNIVMYDSPFWQKLALEKTVPQMSQRVVYRVAAQKAGGFNYQDYYTHLKKAGIGLTTADYLIAQTGTVVFLSKNYPSRMLTLLPEVLIVIVKITQLVIDLVHLHRLIAISGANMSLIYLTGPSCTADIEKKLVLGVHGPKTLYVLVMEER